MNDAGKSRRGYRIVIFSLHYDIYRVSRSLSVVKKNNEILWDRTN
jgi:hypothetical protein